jgi:predicted Zn-dependent protease
MPTLRQRKLQKKLLENIGSMGEAMRQAGYSKAYAKNPQMLTNTKTFKETAEALGLTDDFLVKALKEDIIKKPKNRKPELELAFKIKGHLRESIDLNNKIITTDISQEDFNEIMKIYANNTANTAEKNISDEKNI